MWLIGSGRNAIWSLLIFSPAFTRQSHWNAHFLCLTYIFVRIHRHTPDSDPDSAILFWHPFQREIGHFARHWFQFVCRCINKLFIKSNAAFFEWIVLNLSRSQLCGSFVLATFAYLFIASLPFFQIKSAFTVCYEFIHAQKFHFYTLVTSLPAHLVHLYLVLRK